MLGGIHKHHYETFWEINQLLCDKHIGDMRKFSVRIYSNQFNRMVQPNLPVKEFVHEGEGEID